MKDTDIKDLRTQARLKVTDKPEVSPTVLHVDDSVVATLGNFSLSAGKHKVKKTFHTTAIAASAMKNTKVLNYTPSFPDSKRNVLYVDTEQSSVHCMKVLTRMLELANLPLDEHPSCLEFLCLRKYNIEERMAIIEDAIYSTESLGLVIIDGIRDLMKDINSPTESTELVSKLMKWTDERQIHIHTVLHLNKGDDNTRGHIGTELNNKAETIFKIEKDKINSDISSVEAMCIRDIEFTPFAFYINEDGLPELVNGYTIEQKSKPRRIDFEQIKDAEHKKALDSVFLEHESFQYGELITALQNAYLNIGYSFGYNKATELKTYLEQKEIVLKMGNSYILNTDYTF